MPLHYLALGDSYTIGEAVPASARWPAQLIARLRTDGIAIDDPRIVAVTGWTTDELAAGMDAADLKPGYDLVTLQIGVNNQYRGRGEAEYRGQFRSLLQRAVDLARGVAAHVVVVSIPDWGVTAFGHADAREPAQIARELDLFNAIAHDEARRAGAHWADVTPASRKHPDRVAADGLHPNAAQYTAWVQAIEPVVRTGLGR